MPCNEGLIARYEELRQQALGRASAIPRGQGLALLMRSGMRAWMQAWAQCTVTPPAPPPAHASQEIFPVALHNEVTMLLVGMVLSGRQEAIA